MVGRQRLGFGILSFSKHPVKLFGLRERDTNGIELNSAFDVPANRSQERAKLRRRRALWLGAVEIGFIAEKRSGKKMSEFFSEDGRRRVVLFKFDEFVETERLGLGRANEIGLSREAVMECGEKQEKEGGHNIASAQ